MSRVLKVSGFVGLAVQMVWGMGNVAGHIVGVPPYWGQLVGAHAHFGVLGILAVVTGLAVDQYGTSGTRRTVAVWGFVVGQWLLPATLVAQAVLGLPQLGMLAFVWGICLLVSMVVMAMEAWADSPSGYAA
ncbi:hypothetical protein J2752_000669 [Halarchaeum rubridurum]|uniref:DUF8059 domain-containing protein n=1 Tax=Halarchaeum rubridurum TaxID=489911 RepID=A0A830FXT4_9EURY|nr:hypothetical protein [Halarchaeum rubridurum]MBP1953788.1 hypothetical protein [Halarchaeum rubridurum]GGM54668.1 hypothetical protein GCM10009017_01280 [Halarchaeum rubridurum]